MTPNAKVICVLGVIGAGVIVYLINEQADGGLWPTPANQKETQTEGLNIAPTMMPAAGAPLDMSVETHFWTPGYDDCSPAQPTVAPRHRYPALPGGNISNVMHNGWSKMATNAPAGNDWFTNPPQAAIL